MRSRSSSGYLAAKGVQLIFLHGVSSSGKTSVAKELQEVLRPVWLNFSMDSILYALPQSSLRQMMNGDKIDRPGFDYLKLVEGYHLALAALLKSGQHLIADNSLSSDAQKEHFRNVTEGFKVFCVGVHCDLDVLEDREIERGDRALGTAKRELDAVHMGMEYDLEIDTTRASAAELAQKIASRISQRNFGEIQES